MDADFNSLRRAVLAAVDDSIIPGAVLAVAHHGEALFIEAFGNLQTRPSIQKNAIATVYDLASLTKALVTAPLAMLAVDRGKVALDDSVHRFLPTTLAAPNITLRQLLSHSAGLPAHRRFYENLGFERKPDPGARAAVLALAAAEPLAYAPGSKSVYSDLGFMLLGEFLEQCLGNRLDRLAATEWFSPLGITQLGFFDVFQPSANFPDSAIAPTEECPVRQRLIRGEVHDLNAYAMGGIAGHAGLFGTAESVLRMGLGLCAAYHGKGPVSAATVREFFAPQGIPHSTWRLGFDGPAEKGSLAGELLAKHAVGHLAFTGCSFWMDPESETCVVFLCNRIHPTVRDDARFRALRPAVNDAALLAIGYGA